MWFFYISPYNIVDVILSIYNIVDIIYYININLLKKGKCGFSTYNIVDVILSIYNTVDIKLKT